MDTLHVELVKVADAWIAGRSAKADSDPERPIYHIKTPANWFNDPHGAIFYKGQYHLFMQHAIFQDATGMEKYYDDIMPDEGSMTGVSLMKGWAHMVSKDLVYWEHKPTALVPTPGSYDRYGVWSGCCVIDDEGIPTIFYSGYPLSPVCMAQSFDDMETWVKYEGNPLQIEDNDDYWGNGFATFDVINTDTAFVIYYTNFTNTTDFDLGIAMAWSTDGIAWKRYPDPILTKGQKDSWDG